MATYVITHEVEDVDHWINSPKRAEAFASIGATVREFRDREGSNKTAVVAEIPDFDAFEELMKSDEAAEAMKHDRVNRDTLVILEEGK